VSVPGPSGGRFAGGHGRFNLHARVFAATCAVALAVEWLAGADWPLFWPILIWSVALAMHYFLANALDANDDDDWIEERTLDLRSRSYDFDHIRDIEKRIDEGDASVSPHTERGRKDADGR
jgi:hypothetical protein